MKREFLKNLGIEDNTIIDKILDEYHTSVNEKDVQIKQLTAEKETLSGQLTTLQETVKQFDGVDVQALKTQTETLKTEYENKINQMVTQSAIDKALGGNKFAELLSGKIDRTLLKIEDNKVTGLNEQIEKLKTDYAELFTEQSIKGFKPADSQSAAPSKVSKSFIKSLARVINTL